MILLGNVLQLSFQCGAVAGFKQSLPSGESVARCYRPETMTDLRVEFTEDAPDGSDGGVRGPDKLRGGHEHDSI